MKFRSIYLTTIIFTFLFISSCSFFNTDSYNIKKAGKTFFWEVISDKSTAYILGSVHIGNKSMYPLEQNIMDAFKRSDKVVVELNVKKADPIKMMERMMYQNDMTLEKSVSPELFKKLKIYFEKLNVLPMMYEKMKPWAAVETISMLELMKKGYDEKLGVDMYFLGQLGDREVVELETYEEQLKALDEFNKLTDAYCEYSLDNMENQMEDFKLITTAWKNGDEKKLLNYIDGEIEKFPELEKLMKKLLDKRNIKMTERIKKLLDKGGNYFIIVGAGHLLGEKGIIELLKN